MKGLHSIEGQLNMDRQDIKLSLLELDTDEKMIQFMEWCLSKTEDEEILAMPREIVRAACDISDRLDLESDSAINAARKNRNISKMNIRPVIIQKNNPFSLDYSMYIHYNAKK